METLSLTENQQRHFRASLLIFEKALRLSQQLLLNGNEVGILYRQIGQFGEEQKAAALQKISQGLVELEALVQQIGLKQEENQIEGIIRAQMSQSWAVLEDCRSSRMRGYGELDPKTAEITDVAIHRLSRIAIKIAEIFPHLEGNPEFQNHPSKPSS